MQRHVSFNTRLFESIKPQPHFINERCFGEDLATWLIARLPPAPFVVRKPIQEDYGWGFWVRQGHQSFWSAIGIEDESLGSAAPEWQITWPVPRAAIPCAACGPDQILLCCAG